MSTNVPGFQSLSVCRISKIRNLQRQVTIERPEISLSLGALTSCIFPCDLPLIHRVLSVVYWRAEPHPAPWTPKTLTAHAQLPSDPKITKKSAPISTQYIMPWIRWIMTIIKL